MNIELSKEEARIVVTTLSFVAKLHVERSLEKADLADELLRIEQKILEQMGGGENAKN